jgi:hypothetical protein
MHHKHVQTPQLGVQCKQGSRVAAFVLLHGIAAGAGGQGVLRRGEVTGAPRTDGIDCIGQTCPNSRHTSRQLRARRCLHQQK